MKLEFVGWDVSRKFAVITPADSALLRAMNTPFATFTMDIQRLLENYTANETHLAGFDLPDPITIAYAINSSVANEIREMYLVVETKSQATEGMVVMDTLDVLHQTPNALVVTSARHDVFMSMLMDALKV